MREWLGISTGGTNALLLIALLVGGDYHQGADKVGLRAGFAAVRHLLRNKQVITMPCSKVHSHSSSISSSVSYSNSKPVTRCAMKETAT